MSQQAGSKNARAGIEKFRRFVKANPAFHPPSQCRCPARLNRI
jgi:hypothetical protein